MSDEFELLRDVTIGQYLPIESAIHRVDARYKLVATALFAVAIAMVQSLPGSALVLASILLVAALSRVPFNYLLRGLRPSLPLIVILVVLQVAFRGSYDTQSRVLWQWWFVRVTSNSLLFIWIGVVRLVAFIFLTSLLTLTTTMSHLTHGLESVLGPFQRLGVPAHQFALVLTIALRFVPTLAEELDRISKAQASRCGDIGVKNRWRPDKVARARLPLIVPLFLSALRRGEDLIVAMEARCYVSGKQRTRLLEFKARWTDGLAVGLAACVPAAVWWLGAPR